MPEISAEHGHLANRDRVVNYVRRVPSFVRRAARRAFRLVESDRSRAIRFVGTTPASGQVQFELLINEGLKRDSNVLEIGCGFLHASLPIINYVDPGNYTGMDPTEWLRDVAMRSQPVKNLVNERFVRFSSSDDFDARAFGMTFDFVLAHSVLSHAAHWQLGQFCRNVGALLHEDGKIVASIRLAEGNKIGSPGSSDHNDSRDENWVYPGVSWFTMSTVMEEAATAGLMVSIEPRYTALMTARRPTEVHDWLVFRRAAKVDPS